VYYLPAGSGGLGLIREGSFIDTVFSNIFCKTNRKAPEKAGEAEKQELVDTRKESAAVTSQDEGGTRAAELNTPLYVNAEQRLANFEDSRRRYYEIKPQLFGPPKPETWRTQLARKTKLRKMIMRGFDVVVSLVESYGEAEALKQATVRVSVLERDALLTDPALKPLLGIEENKKLLQALMEQELYKEVNCERFLMIKGLTPAQFHFLIRKMGYNPWSFFSDPRGENAGRVTIHNDLLKDGRHPLADIQRGHPDYDREMALWQPVFPELHHIPWIRDWHMSRTHGVVYGLKDEEGKNVLMFPVHIDPKNAIVTVRDVFGRKKDERWALAYHQIAGDGEGKKSKYVGTGLYDLGCKNFIRLLKDANENGLFANLVIDGADKLRTTDTIVGDDRITWQIAEKVRKEKH
jgi:hypothetical protein